MKHSRKYHLPIPPKMVGEPSPAEIIEAPARMGHSTGNLVELIPADPPIEIIEVFPKSNSTSSQNPANAQVAHLSVPQKESVYREGELVHRKDGTGPVMTVVDCVFKPNKFGRTVVKCFFFDEKNLAHEVCIDEEDLRRVDSSQANWKLPPSASKT